jgi:hypothetical protein
MLLNILSDFDVLWTAKERTKSSIVETMHVSRVHDSLKCYRKVNKQTNPLQVDNLITNKSGNLRNLYKNSEHTVCQNLCFCKCENFLEMS